MRLYQRVVQGAEAGAIAAATVELAFFLLDLVRLEPLATPGVLSGASMGPGGGALDLGSISGVLAGLWGAYQILTLTFTHFVMFAIVGMAASLLFDWSKPGRLLRLGFVALACTLAFFATVGISGSMVALDSIGSGWIIGINVLGAAMLAAGLRFVSAQPDSGDATD